MPLDTTEDPYNFDPYQDPYYNPYGDPYASPPPPEPPPVYNTYSPPPPTEPAIAPPPIDQGPYAPPAPAYTPPASEAPSAPAPAPAPTKPTPVESPPIASPTPEPTPVQAAPAPPPPPSVDVQKFNPPPAPAPTPPPEPPPAVPYTKTVSDPAPTAPTAPAPTQTLPPPPAPEPAPTIEAPKTPVPTPAPTPPPEPPPQPAIPYTKTIDEPAPPIPTEEPTAAPPPPDITRFKSEPIQPPEPSPTPPAAIVPEPDLPAAPPPPDITRFKLEGPKGPDPFLPEPAPPPPTPDATNPNVTPPIQPTPTTASTPQDTAPDTTAQDAERMRRLQEARATQPIQVQIPTTGISDEQNLIDQQISPNDSARVQNTGALVDAANQSIAGSDRNAAAAEHAPENIDPAVGERLARLRALQDETLGKLANGPDRYQLAKDRFGQFEKDTAPEYDLNRRKALNDAANYGYTGSGRLNTAYGDLELSRERDMDSQRSRLFGTALDQSIEDRKSFVNTLGNFANDEASYESATRDELRKERENRIKQGDADVASLYDKGNYLSGQEATQRGVDTAARTEQRGERGYQRDLSEQALADQMNAAKLNDQLTQSEFDRDQTRLNAGYAQDPSAQYEAAANRAFEQGTISQEELQQILAFLAMQKQGAGAGG